MHRFLLGIFLGVVVMKLVPLPYLDRFPLGTYRGAVAEPICLSSGFRPLQETVMTFSYQFANKKPIAGNSIETSCARLISEKRRKLRGFSEYDSPENERIQLFLRFFKKNERILLASLKVGIKEIEKIKKTDLLIIDDFGLEIFDNKIALFLMEIIEDRHKIKSTIISGQYPIASWHEVIKNPTIADAICDRFVYSAHKIDLKGNTMRKNNRNGWQVSPEYA